MFVILTTDLLHQIGMVIKASNTNVEYLLDSFPVAICDNIRICKSRLIHSEDYRGYIASKKRYFYGVRVQLLSTSDGIPVEFVFLPGAANDVRGLNALPLNLPPLSEVYADSAYTDYLAEDTLKLNHFTSSIAFWVGLSRKARANDLGSSACICFARAFRLFSSN
ncbi:transposase [[Phormidium] sp. LEGE 05292]|uniref:transposase n=1 Tax=[Phormidium] sp. LEGE 05292 TaxID=767427 RepID=UPI001D1554F9|nr:transposase [Phormidium sp. LEGE 05292]